MSDLTSQRKSFWDTRSTLGFAAGSGDTNLKQLEINAIRNAIGNPRTVLDAGCGSGHTMQSLHESHPTCKFFGFDYSDGMVNAANNLFVESSISDTAKVCQASLLDDLGVALANLSPPDDGFDCIYTERSIINLDSLDQQVQAIQNLWNLLADGGRLILCEAFIDGLNEINFYRKSAGLDEILPPWHNRYLSISEIPHFLPYYPGRPIVHEFSGTYYFVSRVIHAKEAYSRGVEPSYDSDLNLQSLELPSLPLFGQSKLIIFEK